MDDLGAFQVRLELADLPSVNGLLKGRTFAVKEMFDVAGKVTGGGNPDWRATHPPAERTATAVQACLGAGARLTGITIADELAFSISGENFHYGTPINPAAPDRLPGGSSSGSASATAGGIVDFALGTDTAGSIRVPASYCGLYGLRPTHGRISMEGVMPLSPSFDTVGWFARDAKMLARVGRVFFEASSPSAIKRLLVLEDAFALADADVRATLEAACAQLEGTFGPATRIRLGIDDPDGWLTAFNALRPPEIWAVFGDWIRRARPRFGPQIAERFAAVERMASADTSKARAFRTAAQERAAALLGADGAFVLPTVPTAAPRKGLSGELAREIRERTFRLTCLAPMLGFPEVTLPLGRAGGCPVGLSLIGPRDGDTMLLAACNVFVSAGSE